MRLLFFISEIWMLTSRVARTRLNGLRSTLGPVPVNITGESRAAVFVRVQRMLRVVGKNVGHNHLDVRHGIWNRNIKYDDNCIANHPAELNQVRERIQICNLSRAILSFSDFFVSLIKKTSSQCLCNISLLAWLVCEKQEKCTFPWQMSKRPCYSRPVVTSQSNILHLTSNGRLDVSACKLVKSGAHGCPVSTPSQDLASWYRQRWVPGTACLTPADRSD